MRVLVSDETDLEISVVVTVGAVEITVDNIETWLVVVVGTVSVVTLL